MEKFGVYDEETGRMAIFNTYMDAMSASHQIPCGIPIIY